jgi:hypothetical protein
MPLSWSSICTRVRAAPQLSPLSSIARARSSSRRSWKRGGIVTFGLRGELQRGGGVVLAEREFGAQQVEAQWFVIVSRSALDLRECRRGALDLTFLPPRFGGQQAIVSALPDDCAASARYACAAWSNWPCWPARRRSARRQFQPASVERWSARSAQRE